MSLHNLHLFTCFVIQFHWETPKRKNKIVWQVISQFQGNFIDMIGIFPNCFSQCIWLSRGDRSLAECRRCRDWIVIAFTLYLIQLCKTHNNERNEKQRQRTKTEKEITFSYFKLNWIVTPETCIWQITRTKESFQKLPFHISWENGQMIELYWSTIPRICYCTGFRFGPTHINFKIIIYFFILVRYLITLGNENWTLSCYTNFSYIYYFGLWLLVKLSN